MRLTTSVAWGLERQLSMPPYTERLLVDAGSTGNTNYQNVIVGKGTPTAMPS